MTPVAVGGGCGVGGVPLELFVVAAELFVFAGELGADTGVDVVEIEFAPALIEDHGRGIVECG